MNMNNMNMKKLEISTGSHVMKYAKLRWKSTIRLILITPETCWYRVGLPRQNIKQTLKNKSLQN